MRRMSKKIWWSEMARWIAYNDDSSNLNREDIAGYISVGMICDLCKVDKERVVNEILFIRHHNELMSEALSKQPQKL